MSKPHILIFASGTKDGGGSGFENLVNPSREGDLDVKIVGVVSNYENGGVRTRAELLGISFTYFPGPFEAENYQKIVSDSGAQWVALSGWMRKVSGLDPRRTINIHPALLSQLDHRFGGKGMYGHHIHDAVKSAFDAGEISESGFTMHFVTETLDRGPAFFECKVPLTRGMSADEIAKAVNMREHEWQPKITNMVVHEEIKWDGKDPKNLVVPDGYTYLPKG